MAYALFFLHVLLVVVFVGFSSKPLIDGGLEMIISGAVGCGIVLNFGRTLWG